MKILKYPVSKRNEWFELPISNHSQVLTIQMQSFKLQGEGSGARFDQMMVWAIPEERTADKNLELIAVGTGIELKGGHGLFRGDEKYIGTAQEGPFVWHLFRR